MADQGLSPAEESFMSAIMYPDHRRPYTAEHLSLTLDTIMSDQMNQLTVDNPTAEHPSAGDTIEGAEEVMPWWPTIQMGDNEFFVRLPDSLRAGIQVPGAMAAFANPLQDTDQVMPWWPPRQMGDNELFVRIPNNRQAEVSVPDVMATFPPVAEADLQDPICPCCYVAYGTSAAEDEEAEHPVKTPCNHVFGNQCLETWLPNNSCPICRGELFQARRSRLPSISHLIDDAALAPLVIRVVDGVYSLDGEPLSMAAVHGFRDLARERAENPQPGERQIIFEEAHEDEPPSPNEQFGPDDRLFLVEEVRRMAAHHEYRLYQQLHAEHVVLPGPRWTGPLLSGTLDWRQQRELFREIQRRGAFNYPGMRQYYRDGNGNVLRDAVMFQELRDAGTCWQPDGSWILQDSRPLWNEGNDGIHQSGYPVRGWDVDASPDDPVQPRERANNEAVFNELARSIDTWEF